MTSHPSHPIHISASLVLVLLLALAACSRPWAESPITNLPTESGAAVQQPTAAGGGAPATAAPGSVAIPPASGDFTFLAFHMADAVSGWAMATGQVMVTADGGQNWSEVTPGAISRGTALQVFPFDASVAWTLVRDSSDPNKGTLYRTQDGGKSWQPTAVPFGGGYAQFLNAGSAFFMADRGAAAGSQAIDIYRTTDGGATWALITRVDASQPSNQGLIFGGDKNGITFIDANTGWLTGFIPTEGAAYIYATQNGGKSWSQVALALPAGLEKTQIETEPPVFFGQDGLLTLRASQGNGSLIFYATHDGGKTWKALAPVNFSGLVSTPSINDLYVWDGGTLHASHDGGGSWKNITPNINLTLKIAGFQFINFTTGWALGVEGKTVRMYHSVDGGATWQ